MLTSIPQSLTCSATFFASGQSSGVPVALGFTASIDSCLLGVLVGRRRQDGLTRGPCHALCVAGCTKVMRRVNKWSKVGVSEGLVQVGFSMDGEMGCKMVSQANVQDGAATGIQARWWRAGSVDEMRRQCSIIDAGSRADYSFWRSLRVITYEQLE